MIGNIHPILFIFVFFGCLIGFIFLIGHLVGWFLDGPTRR